MRAIAFLLVALSGLPTAFAAPPAPTWTFVDIAIPGSEWEVTTAVNMRGDVAGWARAPVAGSPYAQEQGFVWSNGTVQLLGVAPNGSATHANAMNDRGVVAGGALYGDALMWKGGAWIDLGFSGEAFGINRAEAIVGRTNAGYRRAFLYRDGTVRDLGTLGGPESAANAINNHDLIVGSATLPDGNTNHAVAWIDGALVDMGTLGGLNSFAAAVNDHGMAVGASQDSGGGYAAFIWDRAQGIRRLFNLPGTHTATAINDHGQVVGGIDEGSYLFDGGVVTRLESLPAVQAAGWTRLYPTGINDRGWITGWATKPGGFTAFVLVPR